MTKRLFIAAILAGMLAGAAAAAGSKVPHGTVTVVLPPDTTFAFKPGTGVTAAQTYCLTCHSAAYVSTQPVLTKAQWTAEVTKMKAAYGAQIPDDQVGPIADYLTATYGKP